VIKTKKGYLLIVLSILFLVGALYTATYISTYIHASTTNPALTPVYPYQQYALVLSVFSVISFIIGLIALRRHII
jgi:hypothetical protein